MYNNSIPYYNYNMSLNRQFGPRPGFRPRPGFGPRPFRPIGGFGGFGGFAVPFTLGFLTAPLVNRPNYYPYPNYPVYY